MIGQKIRTKKYCRGIEQVREAWSIRKKKDKVVSYFENGSEKFLEQSPVERDKPNTKLVLVSREPLLNKPNEQNVYKIDSFNKFSFSQWQKILDKLIDL